MRKFYYIRIHTHTQKKSKERKYSHLVSQSESNIKIEQFFSFSLRSSANFYADYNLWGRME